jgi:hypothetical protein
MKEWLRGLSTRTVYVVFTILFIIPFAMALFPPLYLWGSHWKSGAVILGQPFSMWYWNLNALLIFFLMLALYWVQNARGENDEHVGPSTIQKEGP